MLRSSAGVDQPLRPRELFIDIKIVGMEMLEFESIRARAGEEFWLT